MMSSVLACGDDEPARDRAVFWMTLGTSLGATCSSAETFSVPEGSDARQTIIGTGAGERLVDGDGGFVGCTVQQGSADGQFNFDVDLSAGVIGSLGISGSTTGTTATVDVSFTTTSFGLAQDGCTATVREALAGAIWLDELSCPGLVDRSSPAISCTGTGGLIAENCSR